MCSPYKMGNVANELWSVGRGIYIVKNIHMDNFGQFGETKAVWKIRSANVRLTTLT